jgi:TolB-like protein/two-component SAPR family response regulator/Flp pilus assembly protein TadD
VNRALNCANSAIAGAKSRTVELGEEHAPHAEGFGGMTPFELRLLGEFRARNAAGQAVVVAARKNRALLALLALAPSGSMARERLAGLLWGGRGTVQAQSSLRQALVALRKDLAPIGSPLLSADNERVSLDTARVEIDAVTFQRLAASDEVEALRRAAALYGGEFLADTYISDRGFEEWVGLERRRLADIASRVLEKLCALERGAARVDVARRLLALDPLREASHRQLMQLYAEAGERSIALRQYEICRETLGSQLGVAPDEETEALRRQLLQNSTAQERTTARGGPEHLAMQLETAPIPDHKPVLAVLPFQVFGGDAELEGFADGLTEDIITGLSRISAIRVVARSTMFTFKRRAVDIRTVAGELGAQYVLEGSTRNSETRVRITAQLIEAAGGHHIWAEQIDGVPADMFDLQDEVTKRVVASVQTQVILAEGKVLAGSEGATGRVSRLLARSWQRFLSLSEESLADSRTLAERALQLDGMTGMAHRMVAVALYHQMYMGFIPWTELAVDDVYAHGKLAVESEDADEYSHWAMACAHLLRMQHERALTSLRRALEINPNCSLAHGSIGTVLAWAGQHDASVASNEFALRINPQDPSIFFRHFGLALAHYLASRYEQSLFHASAVLQMRPSWWLGQIIYAASCAQMGRRDEARPILDELTRVRPGMTASKLGVLPHAHPHDREHLLDGLRLAGLRE